MGNKWWPFYNYKTPSILVAEYQNAMLNGFLISENLELSHKNAIRLLKLKSGMTNFNGRKENTVLPMEKTFPYKPITRLRNDLVVEVAPIFDKQKELFDKGAPYYFKFSDGTLKDRYKKLSL